MSIRDWVLGVVLGGGRNRLEAFGVQEMTSIDELDAALAANAGQPVLLFKHSTTCPISASAHRRVAAYAEQAPAGAPPLYLVKVIESRPASNEIAARFGVRHESPQILLVRDGVCRWNASHGGIDGSAIIHAIGEG